MKSILIVDDEERIRMVLNGLLGRRGYKVFESADAVEANEILKHNAVDLVLLDINLGSVNGDILYEVARAFHKGVKIIVSSVYSLDDQRKLIKGAADYYDKSESFRTLLDKINRVLQMEETERKTIVVIDDERKIRLLYHEFLTNAGYDSIEFGDSLSTFNFLKRRMDHIDLIVLDLAMPNIDGADFYEIIKDRYPDTRILIASNYSIDEQEFQVFNADGYYDKSDNKEILLTKIRELI